MKKSLLFLLILCFAAMLVAQTTKQKVDTFNPLNYQDRVMPNLWSKKGIEVDVEDDGIVDQYSTSTIAQILGVASGFFGGTLAEDVSWFTTQWGQAAELLAIPDEEKDYNDVISNNSNYVLNAYGRMVGSSGVNSGDIDVSNPAETQTFWDTAKLRLPASYSEAEAIDRAQENGVYTNSYVIYYDRPEGVTSNTINYQTTVKITSSGRQYIMRDVEFISPIVLDMDGDGVLEASNGEWLPHRYQNARMVEFDINGDDFVEMTEWVGPNDGLLMVTGGEANATSLFGDADGFANGYEKLTVLDANRDKKLTGSELKTLSVWQDKNGNAQIDTGEVKTLAELKISELQLNHRNLVSSFKQNGVEKTMWDWYPASFSLKRTK